MQNTLFYFSIILVSGLAFGRLVKLVKLPNVTGYLLAGLVLGPYVLNVFKEDFVSSLGIVSQVALGFIAFSIGSEFKLSYFKKVGVTPIVIAIFEAIGAAVVVFGALFAFGFDLATCVMLGAIACATAPAATIMVIKQYNAKGSLTQTLLSVVALDDAVALITFGFAVAISKAIVNHVAFSVLSVLTPIYEVVISLVVGALLGVVLTLPMRFFKKNSNRMCIVVANIFLTVALAGFIHGSALLMCMASSCIFVNLYDDYDKVMDLSEYITPPIYMAFFVVSGAELNITIIPTIGFIGVIYILTRVVGKLFGAYLGAVVTKCEPKIKKYLGFTLIPQAGVAIGLSLIAQDIVPEYGAQIRAVILCATLVYEMVGPAISKFALSKAGEIKKG